MPSFDIVCELDKHEVANALDQTNRELGTRFDFKGIQARCILEDNKIQLEAEADFQLQQMLDILRHKLSKRRVDLGHLQPGEPVIQLNSAKQPVVLQEGIRQEVAKKIVQLIKTQKVKVQAAIQGDQIRVTGKKRDDLQAVIELLRQEDFGIPLQFVNFRD
ncbi:MAG: YajQ family cyclic di-GMP-binding protein [Coxiella sp. RIFCSPHIGHO2_12_FULL_44_14]|nr:MAG: YajQ family cyclic di-GMP-binding protein [Coxiella sp. RIFCSPHIGHO2_12_FULL_44_14]